MKALIEELAGASLTEAVRVDTEEYQGSHGRKPRGRGNWMFAFGIEAYNETKKGKYDRPGVMTFNDTYGGALKKAKAHAKKIGKEPIYVLP